MPHDTDQTAPLPLNLEVTLPASGPLSKTDIWGDRLIADRVTYRAHRLDQSPGVTVSVTAFTVGHSNQSWHDGRFFVAPGLDSSPPPQWAPDAPEWFWSAVASMQTVKAGV